MAKHKSRLARALEKPLGAVGATQWLSQVEFCALYRMRASAVTRLIRRGLIQGVKMGGQWRLYNPGWEIMMGMRNPRLLLESLPIITTAQFAEVCGINRRSVNYFRETGRLKAVRRGRDYLFTLTELRKYIKAREKFYKKLGVDRATVVEWAKRRLAKVDPPLHP